MLVGRTQELKNLENIYRKKGSNLVILYGRKGIGKTTLAKEFAKDKPVFYYSARQVTEKEQVFCIQKECQIQLPSADYKTFFKILQRKKGEKPVIILDEFQYMAQESEQFFSALAEYLENGKKAVPAMVLLLSSSINWVENSMPDALGQAARFVTTIAKVKEFSFVDLVKFEKNSTVEDSVYISAVLGGVPAYVKLWQEGKSLKENILSLFLHTQAPLYEEAEHFLKRELRELSAYNAILAALAAGQNKLNEIYERTGFSRAKISVYLKNLIALDIVEKMFSYDTSGQVNAQKGLYRIKDVCLRFWYCFVYPNQSAIEEGNGKEVYEQYVKQNMSVYMRESFRMVCMEFLCLMNQYGKLKYRYVSFGSWFGKTGLIDILAKEEENHYLVAFCDFSEQPMDCNIVEMANSLFEQAEIGEPSEYYLFARNGFTKELRTLAKERGISLICLEDL